MKQTTIVGLSLRTFRVDPEVQGECVLPAQDPDGGCHWYYQADKFRVLHTEQHHPQGSFRALKFVPGTRFSCLRNFAGDLARGTFSSSETS